MIKDQTEEQFIQQAKELAGPAIEILQHGIGRVFDRYTKSILEEMHAQLKARDQRIHNLKNTIGLAISCLQVELGEQAVKQLITALNNDDEGIN